MPKKKPGTKKRDIGKELIQGMEELKLHREGKIKLKTTTISTEENNMIDKNDLDPRVFSVLTTVRECALDLNKKYDGVDPRNRFAYLIGALVVFDFILSPILYKLIIGLLVVTRFAYLNKNLDS